MSAVPPSPSSEADAEELARLRARVADLEGQVAAQARATNAVVARAQESLYWLERWHVDLDAVMRRPGAQGALELVRRARTGVRVVRRLKRRITR